ncbi:hypothetical protein BST61_g9966 [Cercospora zeina]
MYYDTGLLATANNKHCPTKQPRLCEQKFLTPTANHTTPTATSNDSGHREIPDCAEPMVTNQLRLGQLLWLNWEFSMDSTHDAAAQQRECDQSTTKEPSTPKPNFSREELLDMMTAPELELTDLELEEALQSYAATTGSCGTSRRASISMYNEPGFINGRTLDEIFTGDLLLISGSTLYELSKRYKMATIESKINLGRREGDNASTPKLHKELAKHKKRVIAEGSKCLYAYEYELNKARKYHGQPGVHMPVLSLRCGNCATCLEEEEDRAEPDKIFEYWTGPNRALQARNGGGQNPVPKINQARLSPTRNIRVQKTPSPLRATKTPQQSSSSASGKKVRKLPWLTNTVKNSAQKANAAAKAAPAKTQPAHYAAPQEAS